MLRRIKVYGKLRQVLGQSTFEADLHNVGQAFSFFIIISRTYKKIFYVIITKFGQEIN